MGWVVDFGGKDHDEVSTVVANVDSLSKLSLNGNALEEIWRNSISICFVSFFFLVWCFNLNFYYVIKEKNGLGEPTQLTIMLS